jgi:hypothetical protein
LQPSKDTALSRIRDEQSAMFRVRPTPFTPRVNQNQRRFAGVSQPRFNEI